MNKILSAIALSIAIPSIAHAQAAQPPKMAEKMKEKCACCKDMAGKGHDGMQGMDMKGSPGAPGQTMPPPIQHKTN